jgi:hypothetical protein
MHVVKARTLEAKAKARTLKSKAKDMIFCPLGSSRPRAVLQDYITTIYRPQYSDAWYFGHSLHYVNISVSIA